ncbi:hypothetical protein Hs30E_19730 [Lactococcus hodotermopsidis]|uniref:Sigma factor regulator N-terminal domain-containing protein n=1 Tax=Pseudolactococcus hodotermopsidis TaxID=2709157 RepID=A0A6A0BDD5_9LACT|nr:sigma factor regulator N-terminal domain-containing protein [Lactococcus hodotermopsidis]GFH43422.1 hypothetical protein Hs30E_19730 [Lactococcus hodotermopsidis]
MTTTDNFEKIIKTEKRKKVLKMVGISLATTLVLFIGGMMLINKRMTVQGKKVQEYVNIREMIQSPNIESFSEYFSNTQRMSAQMRSERFKNRLLPKLNFEIDNTTN